ncbi:sialidase, partial [Halorubrum sp. SD626R]
PHETIETWAVHDGDVICGSGLFDVPDQRDDVEGRIMRRVDGSDGDGGGADGDGPAYETVGRVDANVSRMEVV